MSSLGAEGRRQGVPNHTERTEPCAVLCTVTHRGIAFVFFPRPAADEGAVQVQQPSDARRHKTAPFEKREVQFVEEHPGDDVSARHQPRENEHRPATGESSRKEFRRIPDPSPCETQRTPHRACSPTDRLARETNHEKGGHLQSQMAGAHARALTMRKPSQERVGTRLAR